MPIAAPSFTVRRLCKEEIPLMLELAKAEGRHMGSASEVETWMEVDSEGFIAAVSDEGEILGGCCGIILSDHHGYVGMYVVRSEYRGAGIGKKVWNAAIEHLGDRNKGLSAVGAYFPVYREKAGFSVVADWTVDLYKLESADLMARKENALPTDTQHSMKLRTVPLEDVPVDDVVNYDAGLHSYDRSRIVQLVLKERDCICRVALLGDTVCGYGCVKPNLQGLWLVAPLYADNEVVATLLLSDLLNCLPEEDLARGVVLKAPSHNTAAVRLLEKFGFTRQTYSLHRCYTKTVFDIPAHCIYALQSSVFSTE